jgi:hypothetical protein
LFFCRVEITEELVIALFIEESTMEDGGEYSVRVYNEYGEVTSTTQVVVLFEAPTFTVPLSDQPVAPGDSGVFNAAFRGIPAPRTTWLVSSLEITESEKYHIEMMEELQTQMSVRNVTVDDTEMTYTCRVFNAAGETTSTARLILKGTLHLLRLYGQSTCLSFC